jgi:hypothetical protein
MLELSYLFPRRGSFFLRICTDASIDYPRNLLLSREIGMSNWRLSIDKLSIARARR